ncbi:UDP-Glycosyltransferase superfamily protein [Perilla frutescens var. hirtella]|nr:UDP-Glycosyltransferase superfamily protein [Perilla frutescens var. hirtella]
MVILPYIKQAKEKGVSADKISDWDTDVRARVEEMSQSQHLDDSAEGDGGGIDMSSLFVDVVGISQKKRVFGLGNRSHIYSASSGESTTREPIVIAKKKREDAKRHMEEVLQYQIQQHQRQMQEMIEAYLSHRMQPQPPLTS